MARAWFLQANPEKHDIDAALEELEIIHWRVPQHTGELSPGDITLLWRSGAEAGIVGVGRIAGPPVRAPQDPSGARFNLEPSKEGEIVTRAPVKVRKIAFIPKSEVEAIPEFSQHQIVIAPRPTVYPLDAAQWAAIEPRLSAPPPEIEPFAPGENQAFPRPFAWSDRRRGVNVLPGGYGAYLESLRAISEWVYDSQPERNDLEGWLRTTFGMSDSSARFLVDFLERIGFLRGGAGRYDVAPEIRNWMSSRDHASLIALLHSRVQFIGEMLHELQEPRSPEQLRRIAKSKYGIGWSSRAQIDRRRGWLQSAGLIQMDDEGRLTLTEQGRALLGHLELHEPQASLLEPALEAQAEPLPTPKVVAEIETDIGAIVETLRSSAHNTADPAALERAVADAFAFLGFDSTWLGGAGKTDVLLVADLGPEERYRVVVDCKTTSRDAVADQQIDWITLRDHKVQHEADFVALVAPAFRGTRLSDRALEHYVALLTVDELIGLCEQHAVAPLGLDTYRRLFAEEDAEGGAQAIAEASEEASRWLTLASHIVRVLRELEKDESALGPKDLCGTSRTERSKRTWVRLPQRRRSRR